MSLTLDGKRYKAININDEGVIILVPEIIITPPVQSNLVPDPVIFVYPISLKDIAVSNQIELDLAIKNAKPGDRIILSPGIYNNISFKYKTGGNKTNPIIFTGNDTIINTVSLVNTNDILLHNLKITAGGISINGTFNIGIVNCDIKPQNAACGIYVTNTPDNTGGFYFLNNRIIWDGIMIPAVWGSAPMAGIFFAMQRNIGNNVRISGNLIARFHDGISMGQLKIAIASSNLLINQNYIYDIEDDGIEADGWHINSKIINNVLGGTQLLMLAGISAAPMGPGPNLIANNFIGGFYKLPLKLNNAIDGAITDRLEFKNNIIVQPLTDANTCFYLPGPMIGVSNINIHDNIIYSRGAIFVTEQLQWLLPGDIIPGMILNYNRMWSTLERMLYNSPTLFRFLNIQTQSNIYMKTLTELQAYGFELNGTYAKFNVTPIPISITPGNSQTFPIEKLCKWSIV